jgi:phage gp36-like protein
MKTCSKCGETKVLDAFYRSKTGVSGRHSYCKACGIAYAKERWPTVYAKNKDQMLARAAEWQRANPDRYKKRLGEWVAKNREHVREAKKQSTKKGVDELIDGYVAGCIGLPLSQIPRNVLEMKREQLSLQRLTKQLKQELTNQLESKNGN